MAKKPSFFERLANIISSISAVITNVFRSSSASQDAFRHTNTASYGQEASGAGASAVAEQEQQQVRGQEQKGTGIPKKDKDFIKSMNQDAGDKFRSEVPDLVEQKLTGTKPKQDARIAAAMQLKAEEEKREQFKAEAPDLAKKKLTGTDLERDARIAAAKEYMEKQGGKKSAEAQEASGSWTKREVEKRDKDQSQQQERG